MPSDSSEPEATESEEDFDDDMDVDLEAAKPACPKETAEAARHITTSPSIFMSPETTVVDILFRVIVS